MPENLQYPDFKAAGCCVIIPTYNNETTLESVISGVLTFTPDIIVVNDGSTGTTRQICAKFSDITVIHLDRNRGKGYAIRQGFKEALRQGFRYAITIDSDGQHLPADLPAFIAKITEAPDSLIIGARNMDQDGIPGGSSFGNKFSNFWTWVETGYTLPDTQSGYRLYPVKKLEKVRFFTNRFEFEIEVLIRSAWKGIPLRSVPVSVVYHPEKERVSHFRPFTDFARISLLNSVLTILAILFFRPWMIIRKISKEGFRELMRKHLVNPEESNFKKSASIALGIFMGIAPVWGWQMMIALALAVVFKLNKAITLIASNISIPPMIPFILFASYLTGGLVMNSPERIDYSPGITLEFVEKNLLQYVVGALIFGACLALLTGLATYLVLAILRPGQKRQAPINETGKP